MTKKIFENALSLGIMQVVNLGLPLLSLPYLALKLGVDQLGRMAFALAVAQLLLMVTDYGFNLSASKAIAVNRHNPAKITEIWCVVTFLRVVFALGGIFCIAVSTLFFERARSEIGLFVAAYAMVIGNVLFPQWLFQGLEQLRIVSIAQMLARVIVFSLIFVLVKSEEDLYWATFLQSAGFLLGGLLALPQTLRAIRGGEIRLPGKPAIVAQLKEGWPVFLSTAAVNVYTTSNSFILGLFVAPVTLGYYHVAEKLIRAVQTIYSAISNAVYPHVSHLASSDRIAVLNFNRKFLKNIGSVAVLASLCVYFIGPYVIKFVFGQQFLPAADILRVFALLPIIIIFSNIFGVQTMLPLGMESAFSRVLLCAAVFDFAVFIPAAYMFGGIGAAWANIAVELFVSLTMAVLLHIRGRNPITFHLNKVASQNAKT